MSKRDAFARRQSTMNAENPLLDTLLLAKHKEIVELEVGSSICSDFKLAVSKLAFPLEKLQNGLSELGPSPVTLAYVYQKLALPVPAT